MATSNPTEPLAAPAAASVGLIREVNGARPTMVLMRHAERFFDPNNLAAEPDQPLTDTGRAQALSLGRMLPAHEYHWSSSPRARCLSTASLIAEGSGAGRVDPEPHDPLAPFFIRDPGPFTELCAENGPHEIFRRWLREELPDKIIWQPRLALATILAFLRDRLNDDGPHRTEIAITHDIVIVLLRHYCLRLPLEGLGPTGYLHGVAIYRTDTSLVVRDATSSPTRVSESLLPL